MQEPPRQGQPPARASAHDKKYIANMLGAVSALQEHEKCAPGSARLSGAGQGLRQAANVSINLCVAARACMLMKDACTY